MAASEKKIITARGGGRKGGKIVVTAARGSDKSLCRAAGELLHRATQHKLIWESIHQIEC